MDNVSVSDDVRQWKTLFRSMSRGGSLANINDIRVDKEPVDGLPANVTGLDGNLQAPKHAANVLPPRQEKAPVPEVYKQDTEPLGHSQGIDMVGRPKTSRGQYVKRGGTRKKSTSRSTTKRRKTPAARSTSRSTKKRRANIVKRRR